MKSRPGARLFRQAPVKPFRILVNAGPLLFDGFLKASVHLIGINGRIIGILFQHPDGFIEIERIGLQGDGKDQPLVPLFFVEFRPDGQ